jgi:hypothetical protein
MHYNEMANEEMTFEEIAITHFGTQETNDLDKLLNDIWDPWKVQKESRDDAEYNWNLRSYLFRIVNHDPIIMLGFDEEIPASELSNRYWDKSSDYNPCLIFEDRPLAILTMAMSAKFGFPWAGNTEIQVVWNDLRGQEAAFREKIERVTGKKRVTGTKRLAITSPDRDALGPLPGRAVTKTSKITPEKEGTRDETNPTQDFPAGMDDDNGRKREVATTPEGKRQSKTRLRLTMATGPTKAAEKLETANEQPIQGSQTKGKRGKQP